MLMFPIPILSLLMSMLSIACGVRNGFSTGNLMLRMLEVRGGGTEDSKVQLISTEAEFDSAIEEAGSKLIVVDFSATWCMPCKMIAPVYEEMSSKEEFSEVVFLKIDVDENPAVAERYRILSMPTFLFIKSGEVVERFSGASVEKLNETLFSLLK